MVLVTRHQGRRKKRNLQHAGGTVYVLVFQPDWKRRKKRILQLAGRMVGVAAPTSGLGTNEQLTLVLSLQGIDGYNSCCTFLSW